MNTNETKLPETQAVNQEETAETKPENGSEEPLPTKEIEAPTQEGLLEEKEAELADLKSQMLRLQAETENFKRRMKKEKDDFAQYANERLIKALIPIYENLHRALSAKDANYENLKQGVDMIFKEFTSFLKTEKVKPIAAVGEKFDPAIHEACSQMESADHKENTVIQEFTKGFYLNDRVLRPAKVVISKKPAEAKPDNAEEKPTVQDKSAEASDIPKVPSGAQSSSDKPPKTKA